MGFKSAAFIILLFSYFGSSLACAADSGRSGFFNLESKRIGVHYSSLSGNKYESFTGNPAFGLEAGISRGNAFLQFLAKLRLDYSAGQADFLDSSTALSLDYKYVGVNSGLGIRINPVMSTNSSALGIYFGAVGTFGIAQLTLPDRTFTELQSSQVSTTVGYDVFAGIELGAAKSGSRIYLEAGLRTARAKLAGENSFQIDGLVLQGGLSW